MNAERLPDNQGLWLRQESLLEEEYLYNYLLEHLKQDSPLELLEEFCCIFIKGRGFKDDDAYLALAKIVRERKAEQFIYFLNRCCHILIKSWQMDPEFHPVILQLVSSFERLPMGVGGNRNVASRVRRLVKQFTASDQYVKLQRLARVINANEESKLNLVGNLIHRYPYLYDYYLASENSCREQQQTIRHIKASIQRHFELSLSQYVTYKVRLVQTASAATTVPAPAALHPVSNPTLLSEYELSKALKQFIGTVESGYTYKDISHNFLIALSRTPDFRAFKDDLFQYLSSSLDSPYGQSKLSPKLYEYLQNLMPECNKQQPNEFLVLRTCSHLLNFLGLKTADNTQYHLFIDIVTNLGVTRTISLLVKLILICHKIKPSVERRFSILFNHYESFYQDEVPWLIKALEYTQIAFAIHFGTVNFSGIKRFDIS